MQTDRLAIISDIHGHYEGLCAVLEDIRLMDCDRIVCLGDLVDGGSGDEQVVRYIEEHRMLTVRGNHDENNSLMLSPEASVFLQNLPETYAEEDILFTHISPRRKKNKITDEYEAWNAFDECDYRRIFVGHAHIPLLFGERCEHSASSTPHALTHNEPVLLAPDDRYIICVGAVGYGRDGIKSPRYCIYDRAKETIEMRLVSGSVLPFG